MKRFNLNREWLPYLVLILSLPAIFLVPWASFWGFDLQNTWAFQNCAVFAREYAGNPYVMSGEQCHDAASRYLPYPPLLFHSFFWLKYVSLETAIRIWCAAIVVLLTALVPFWIKVREKKRLALFWILLLLQFPMAFTLERANNDLWAIALWTLAFWAYSRQRMGASGFLLGTAAAYKVYPIIGLSALLGGKGLWALKQKGKELLRFAVFFAAAVFAAYLFAYALWPELGRVYWLKLLPEYSKLGSGIHYYAHALSRSFEGRFWIPALAIRAAVFFSWMVAAFLLLKKDPKLIFAGTLAISTYFSGMSFDYNLITFYPLFLVLFERKRRVELALGLFAVCGNRYLFIKVPVFLPMMQTLWLTGLAVWACRGEVKK